MTWPLVSFRQWLEQRRRRVEHGHAFAQWFHAAGRRLEAEERRDSRSVHAAIEAMRQAFTRRLKLEAGAS